MTEKKKINHCHVMMALEQGWEETEGHESRLKYLIFQVKDINSDKFNTLIGENFKYIIILSLKQSSDV